MIEESYLPPVGKKYATRGKQKASKPASNIFTRIAQIYAKLGKLLLLSFGPAGFYIKNPVYPVKPVKAQLLPQFVGAFLKFV